MKADIKILEALHNATAERLLDIIQNGVVVGHDDTGGELRESASAAHIAQALKMLKDNNIEVVPVAGDPLDQISHLPEFDDDEHAEDLPTLN